MNKKNKNNCWYEGFPVISVSAKDALPTLLFWLEGGVTGGDKFKLNACIER